MIEGKSLKRGERMFSCTTIITIEGMTCGHCEQTVEEGLHGVPGVTDVIADREDDQASVDRDADSTALIGAVEDAGYTANI